jgi:hypothetical protein
VAAESDDLGRCRSLFGFFVEAGGGDGGEGFRAAVEFGFLLEDAVHDRGEGVAGEGQAAGGGEGGQDAEREHVGRRCDGVAEDLFGGHVGGGAGHGAGTGDGGEVGGAGDAEVDDLGAVGGEDHVGGLEIPVDDAGGVDGLQRLGHPGDQSSCGGGGEGPVLGDGVVQRRSGDVGGGQPGLVGVGVRVDHGDGVEAVHAARGGHFLLEAFAEGLVLGVLAVHELDRHRGAGGRASQVDPAHAARAEHRLQPVGADGGGISGGERAVGWWRGRPTVVRCGHPAPVR